MDSRVTETTGKLLSLWESGEMAPSIARSLIERSKHARPSDEWSLGNRLVMLINGTEDARGFRQWEQVGRKVSKGSKAFYILGPITKKITATDPETGKTQEKYIPVGFKTIPVFRFQDTEGEAIQGADYEPAALPPLAEVAESWGIKVHYGPSSGDFYGYYQPSADLIYLATHDVVTFFHELAHAAHNKIEKLKGGQDPVQEIVAETAAAALCMMYGYEGYLVGARQYVANYANEEPEKAARAVMKTLSMIEKVLDLILTTAAELAPGQAVAA